jgi:CVNH domain
MNHSGSVRHIRYFLLTLSFLLLSLTRLMMADDLPLGSVQQSCPKVEELPNGTYQHSCQNSCVDSPGSLTAVCRTHDGRWGAPTRLSDFHHCVGDISNQDGSLRCNRGSVPQGTYTSTCRDISVDQFATLHASCQHPGGAWIESSLPQVNQCVGDIFSSNGVLSCARAKLPTGSYSTYCSDVSIDANSHVLTARCRNSAGGVTTSVLDLVGCNSDIYVVDGYLTCNKGSGAVPDGSYKSTCRDLTAEGSVIHRCTNTPNCRGGMEEATLLKALCRQSNGNFVNTEIYVEDCQFLGKVNDIANYNGALQCIPISQEVKPPPPPPVCPGPLCPPPTPQPGWPPGFQSKSPTPHPASAKVISKSAPEDFCKDGFVPREAIPGDHICVSPATRAQVQRDNAGAQSRRQPGADTCKPGFVWREATKTDHVCVSEATRQQALTDNQHASERQK